MDETHGLTGDIASQKYDAALRKAFWRKIGAALKHNCNDLVPAQDVFQNLQLANRRDLGLQNVALDDIVGSAGRAQAFDLAFYPKHRIEDGRWQTVAQAYYQNVTLPPVLLIKVGKAYFVEDGNHRVSVASALGKKTVRARVFEIDSSSLTPESGCTRLGFKV